MNSKTNFILSLLLAAFLFHSCYSFDTIKQGESISDAKNQVLLSSDENFKLGFFSPGNSTNHYLGIWFNKVSQLTAVWVANRETPLKAKTGIFQVTENGNIAIYADEIQGFPIWSSNVSGLETGNSTVRLLSSGNLVLSARMMGSIEVVWQSFDYPTDTVLPGMKFGMDKRTGLNRVLTSWKADDNPAPGEFLARAELKGIPQFFVYKNSAPFWRAGPWNGRSMSGLPVVASRLKDSEFDISNQIDMFNYSFVDNDNEMYVTFGVPSSSIFSILTLEPLGVLQRRIWRDEAKLWVLVWLAPQDQCDGYEWCGPFGVCNSSNAIPCSCLPGYEPEAPKDWVRTCVKKTHGFACGKGEKEGFIKVPSVKVPDSRVARHFANLSLQECETECLKSCNCTGYASANTNVGGRGCFAWYGELTDTRSYVQDGQDFYLRVDLAEIEADSGKGLQSSAGNKHLQIIISFVVVLGVLLFISCFSYYIARKVQRKGTAENQKHQEMPLTKSQNSLLLNSTLGESRNEEGRNPDLIYFALETVLAATENFSPQKKLGQGGFGPVYKGQLSNGQEIAVKRLSENSGQGISEFKNEASLIAKLQHRNLVRLLGCCIENKEKILLYEYMPNKSLDYFLFDENRRSLLDWKTRHEIILGIARGILYLHQDSRLRIIHRDLKTSNILLDEDMTPKISDFGTARIFGVNQNEASTNRVVGTFGYMSPEYALGGVFSVKSDVFSFGVIVLEIVSGRKNIGTAREDPSPPLTKHAWELWNNGEALEMVDKSIADSSCPEEFLRCIQVGLLCVQDNADERPKMSSVVFMLSNETTVPLPKRPNLTIERPQSIPEILVSETGTSSTNDITITTLDAR